MCGVLWKIGKGFKMTMQNLLEKRRRLLELTEKREGRVRNKPDKDEYSEFYIAIGARIRNERVKSGITQQDLAYALGVQRTSIVNMEAGLQRFPIHKIYVLSVLLGVSAKSLLPDDFDDLAF